MSSADQTSSRVAAVTACYIVPIPLELIATSLRIYARQRQARAGLSSFATDDFFILFATVGRRPHVTSFLHRPLVKVFIGQMTDPVL